MVEFGIARREDLDQIVALLLDDELGATRESRDVAVYESAFQEISDDDHNYLVVGRDGHQVVSVVQLSILPNLSREGTKRAQLEGVRVVRSRRSEGIGKEMCRWAIEMSRTLGCGLVQLTTDRRRPDAVAFYEGLGFRNTHAGFKLHLSHEGGAGR